MTERARNLRDEKAESGSQNGPYQPYNSESFKSGFDLGYFSGFYEGKEWQAEQQRAEIEGLKKLINDRGYIVVDEDIINSLVDAAKDKTNE